MWFQETEGAKFWMQVLSELKQRGVRDILLCCVDGLKGFPEAIEAIYPATVVQTCVVHLIRHSLKYVPRREREQVARDLKPICCVEWCTRQTRSRLSTGSCAKRSRRKVIWRPRIFVGARLLEVP